MKFWGFLLIFFLGVGTGLSVPYIASQVPLLSKMSPGTTDAIEGAVVRKLREADHLLLTISTPRGALLATFKKQATEVDLLVDEGDVVALALHPYKPFIKDPALQRVMKKEFLPMHKATEASSASPLEESVIGEEDMEMVPSDQPNAASE